MSSSSFVGPFLTSRFQMLSGHFETDGRGRTGRFFGGHPVVRDAPVACTRHVFSIGSGWMYKLTFKPIDFSAAFSATLNEAFVKEHLHEQSRG